MTSWKKIVLTGAVILFFGILLRFTNLNSLPIFADEAIYVRWSQVMRAEATLRFLPLSDGKQTTSCQTLHFIEEFDHLSPWVFWDIAPFARINGRHGRRQILFPDEAEAIRKQ